MADSGIEKTLHINVQDLSLTAFVPSTISIDPGGFTLA